MEGFILLVEYQVIRKILDRLFIAFLLTFELDFYKWLIYHNLAFVAAKTMGARLGRWDIEGDPPMGSPTNAVVGLFMLWWGWFAFNAGSTFGNL